MGQMRRESRTFLFQSCKREDTRAHQQHRGRLRRGGSRRLEEEMISLLRRTQRGVLVSNKGLDEVTTALDLMGVDLRIAFECSKETVELERLSDVE